MAKTEFENLQETFNELCNKSDARAGFAFFVGKQDKAAIVFNSVSDDELMHMMATLTSHLAKKHNLTTQQVLEALADGLAEPAAN